MVRKDPYVVPEGIYCRPCNDIFRMLLNVLKFGAEEGSFFSRPISNTDVGGRRTGVKSLYYSPQEETSPQEECDLCAVAGSV